MSDSGCLVHIPWESRNLGVESFALADSFVATPDEALLCASLQRKIEDNGRIFAQARLAKQQLVLSSMLERYGFSFVEATLKPFTVLRKNPRLDEFVNDRLSVVPGRFASGGLHVRPLDRQVEGDCRRVREIAAESFTDDRFHLDPLCSTEMADRRFVFWVDDLLADGTVIVTLLVWDGTVIAFMARRGDHLILAGFARSHVNSGLGEYLWLAVLAEMRAAGLPQARTLIACNNIPVLNLYSRLGFKFRDPEVTFHYWSDGVAQLSSRLKPGRAE